MSSTMYLEVTMWILLAFVLDRAAANKELLGFVTLNISEELFR